MRGLEEQEQFENKWKKYFDDLHDQLKQDIQFIQKELPDKKNEIKSHLENV